MTIVPTIKVVNDIIASLKDIANNPDENNEDVVNHMIRLRTCLETEHEGFMDIFVEKDGIYNLQNCLRNLQTGVKQQVFEVVPRFFSFNSSRQYIKGKLDFFTALYEFMDHRDHPGLRYAVTTMFIKIIKRLPKGTYAFNLITKAAIN